MIALAMFRARAERQVRGNPDDEEKEREDEISECPPVPHAVSELVVRGARVTGIIDQEHPDNREAAKDVERAKARRRN